MSCHPILLRGRAVFRSAGACLSIAALTAAARAQSEAHAPDESMLAPAPPVSEARRRVVIGLVGSERIDESDRRALSGLLEAERGTSSVTRIEEVAASKIASWIAATERDNTVRLSAVLDTRSRRAWELYLVDALRGRAIRRQLPLDSEGTPAALESAATVILSAVRALEEGLEIASTPVEALLPTHVGTREETPLRPPPASPLLRASLGVVATAFEPSVPFTSGIMGTVGVSLVESVTLRLGFAQYLPAELDSPVGDFKVLRSTGVVSVGALSQLAAWELEGELGAATELLRRGNTASNADAVGQPGSTAVRAGPALGGRIRLRLSSWCALEWAASAVYYLHRVEYVVAPLNQQRLATPWQFVVGTQLGLELTLSSK